LRQIIISNDDELETLFKNIAQMPIVLCHGDVWCHNVFYSDGKITLIDWESINWGHAFDDILHLVSDMIIPYSDIFTINIESLDEYYRRFMSAYLKSFSEHADISQINYSYMWKKFITDFGYGVIGWYLSAETEKAKRRHIDELQKFHQLQEIKL